MASRFPLEDEYSSSDEEEAINSCESVSLASYFCHVTHEGCEESIKENGLLPFHSVAWGRAGYDGWLAERGNEWIVGTWFVVRYNKPLRSCYPYSRLYAPSSEDLEIDPIVREYNNPMVSISTKFDFIKDLRHWDWFLVSAVSETNIKFACISKSHPKRKLIKRKPIVDMHENESLQIDEEGNYYVPENGYISVFVIGIEDEPISVVGAEWGGVDKIVGRTEMIDGDRVVSMYP